MPIIEDLDRNAERTIQTCARAVRSYWRLACEAEGIPEDSMFVVFSPENKWAKAYNAAAGWLVDAISQHKAVGYVGLTTQTQGGRAAIPKPAKGKGKPMFIVRF